jgi:hypothetical protein
LPTIDPNGPAARLAHAGRILVYWREDVRDRSYGEFLLDRHFDIIDEFIDEELKHDEEVVRTLPKPTRRNARPEPDGATY